MQNDNYFKLKGQLVCWMKFSITSSISPASLNSMIYYTVIVIKIQDYSIISINTSGTVPIFRSNIQFLYYMPKPPSYSINSIEYSTIYGYSNTFSTQGLKGVKMKRNMPLACSQLILVMFEHAKFSWPKGRVKSPFVTFSVVKGDLLASLWLLKPNQLL